MDIPMSADPDGFDTEGLWGNMASMKDKVRIILHSSLGIRIDKINVMPYRNN